MIEQTQRGFIFPCTEQVQGIHQGNKVSASPINAISIFRIGITSQVCHSIALCLGHAGPLARKGKSHILCIVQMNPC